MWPHPPLLSCYWLTSFMRMECQDCCLHLAQGTHTHAQPLGHKHYVSLFHTYVHVCTHTHMSVLVHTQIIEPTVQLALCQYYKWHRYSTCLFLKTSYYIHMWFVSYLDFSTEILGQTLHLSLQALEIAMPSWLGDYPRCLKQSPRL